jgi:hypothetical protein
MVNLIRIVYIAADSVQTDNGLASFGIWMPGGSYLAASSGEDSRAGSLARTEAHAILRSLYGASKLCVRSCFARTSSVNNILGMETLCR